MKTSRNIIPKGRNAVINFARISFTGVQQFGVGTGLLHNTEAAFAADFHDFIGDPATPEVPGKQMLYATQLVALKGAYVAKGAALKAGREFCRLAISLLKPALGNEWNTKWKEAGFAQPSLAVPRQPVALLTALRGYFATHPAFQNAPANITAAQAQALAEAIDAAILAVGTGRAAKVSAKRARDAAFQRLRKRLSSLRAELEQLLSKEDGRWEKFGFRRPAEGRMPAPVAEVTATPASPTTVLVTWPAASLAEKYRVAWWPSDQPDAVVEAALTADTQWALTGLSPGVPIVVGVSARNRSGETARTEAMVMLEAT
jgi:hypothetical protein